MLTTPDYGVDKWYMDISLAVYLVKQEARKLSYYSGKISYSAPGSFSGWMVFFVFFLLLGWVFGFVFLLSAVVSEVGVLFVLFVSVSLGHSGVSCS